MPKLFSVAEANATLPLVRRIVQDIVRTFERWEQAVTDLEVANVPTVVPDAARSAELEEIVQKLAGEIQGYGSELEQLGIALKDPKIGLIDFPAVIGGRTVWLCWRLGEPAVEFWHELEGGYSGRQRLAPNAA